MIKRRINNIILLLFILITVSSWCFWKHRFVPEFFTITAYSTVIFFAVERSLQKTNEDRIVIRTRKFNWMLTVLWVLLGLFQIRHSLSLGTKQIFGLISESTSQGIFSVLLGLAAFQQNLIIDDRGVRVNALFTSLVKYEDLAEFNLTNDYLIIYSKDSCFQYKIFRLSDQMVDEINKRMEQEYMIP